MNRLMTLAMILPRQPAIIFDTFPDIITRHSVHDYLRVINRDNRRIQIAIISALFSMRKKNAHT